MNAINYDYGSNYQTTLNGVEIYVDHTNNRLKILEHQCIDENIVKKILDFAIEENLGKIILNCRVRFLKVFKNCGFKIEGIINGFFLGEDAYCISFFIDKEREISARIKEEDSTVSRCLTEAKRFNPDDHAEYTIRDANVKDIPPMIKIFSEVFETYPSPVFSMEYLKKVMNKRVLFKVAVQSDKIISIASADMDKLHMNAEITDCATYPEHRGRGLLPNLIFHLEHDLKAKGLHSLYSLSRAINPGINKVLSNLDYKYGGRLINNCHICGGFEDMNIWVKNLKK